MDNELKAIVAITIILSPFIFTFTVMGLIALFTKKETPHVGLTIVTPTGDTSTSSSDSGSIANDERPNLKTLG